ncbi:MAG: endonuclease domain-containing protein [Mangrovibacterium sp.]
MSEESPIGRARRLRQEMTKEEQTLWHFLRGRRFIGYKFLRQHPIYYQLSHNKQDYFIADFYCASEKLVVEIDGKIHDYRQEYDENRDAILRGLGLRVLRIKNEELTDLTAVLTKIENHLRPKSN